MGVIATKDNQLNLYICNKDSLTKKVIAMAHSTKKELNIVDVCKTRLTGTEWLELASKSGLNVFDFIQTHHTTYLDLYQKNGVSMDEESAIKILNSHPEVLVYPIALKGKKAVLCKNETDILQFQT